MSITVIYHVMSLTTVWVSLRRVKGLPQWFIMLCLWLHSVLPRRVIGLSQWFIMPCLSLLHQYHQEDRYVYHSNLSRYDWLYCISITKKSNTSITVIYHAMTLTTVSVSLRRVIGLSVIYHAMSDYCISITKKRDTSITVIYHAMFLTVLYQYD